jgi:hypothetical protein
MDMKLKMMVWAIICGVAMSSGLACAPGVEATAKAEPERVTLPRGTKVSLILLKQLESGGSRQGEEVPLLVVEDVKDEKGRILIAKGTEAQGKVTWSRKSSAFTELVNQPARLAISIDETKAVDGGAVKLTANLEDEEGAEFGLNRSNTRREEASAQLQEVFKDDSARQALEEVLKMMDESQRADLQSLNANISTLTDRLSLPNTQNLARQGELGKIADLLSQLRRGSVAADLLTGGSGMTLGAVMELADLTRRAGGSLFNMFKGRNIKAYIGTPLEAFVAEDVVVTIGGGN